MEETAKAEIKPHLTASAIATHALKGLFSDYNKQLEWMTNAIKDHTADLRAQLAERDELIRVLNTAKDELMARCDKYAEQLAERDAQLAFYEERMRTVLGQSYSEGNKTLRLALEAKSYAGLDKLARQPTQDKGE